MKDYDPDKYPEFIRVKAQDVTLKFIFDNIRNIGIAALLFSLGVVIAKGEPINALFSLPYTEIIIGVIVCVGAFMLATLNFIQVPLAVLATKKSNMPIYLIVSLLLHIITFEVFFKQVLKVINN